MAAGLLPLDVLLRTMRRKWDDGDHEGAVSLARIAAPYLHARQASQPTYLDLRSLSDDQLSMVCDDADDQGVGRHDAG